VWTPEQTVTVLAAAAAVVGAVTALVIQTGRLITIAERYMLELAKQNALQAVQVAKVTEAIVGITPTEIGVVSPTAKAP
jgi:hypothetical protein